MKGTHSVNHILTFFELESEFHLVHECNCGFMQLATLRFERKQVFLRYINKLKSALELRVIVFKIPFGEVYRRFYGCKQRFNVLLTRHCETTDFATVNLTICLSK